MIGIKQRWILLIFLFSFFLIILPLFLFVLYIRSKQVVVSFKNDIENSKTIYKNIDCIYIDKTGLYVNCTRNMIDLTSIQKDDVYTYNQAKLEEKCDSFLRNVFGEFGLRIFFRKAMVLKFIQLVNYLRFINYVNDANIMLLINNNVIEIVCCSKNEKEKHEIVLKNNKDALSLCNYIINILC